MLTACVVEDDDMPLSRSLVGVGDECPPIEFVISDSRCIEPPSLCGETVSLPSHEASSVSVLVFFNTGCRDCQAELPVLQRLADTNPTVRFYCVARSESAETIDAYWASHGLTLPFSAQPDATLFSKFATAGIPRIYILDKRGIIKASFSDSPLPSFDELTEALTVQ